VRTAHADSFSRLVAKRSWIGAPSLWVHAAFDVTMKRRIRPLRNLLHQPMPDRIVVDVIHVALVIALLTDLMLPKSPLPKIAFSPLDS
jgi:hypothetical protein